MALTLDQLVQQSGSTKSSLPSLPKAGSLSSLVKDSQSPTPQNQQYKNLQIQKNAQAANDAVASVPSPFSPSSLIRSAGNVFGGAVKAATAPIVDMAKGSFNQATNAYSTLSEANGPASDFEKTKASFDLVSGVGGVFFSPLAGVINPVSKLINDAATIGVETLAKTPPINYIGKKIADIPGFSSQSTQDTADKILQVFNAAGNASMAILGAKGGELKAKVGETPKIEAPVVEKPVEPVKPIAEAPTRPVQASSMQKDNNILKPSEIDLYGKEKVSEVGVSMYGGISEGLGKEIAQKMGEENLRNIGALAQAGESIEVRQDARAVVRILSDRIDDNSKIQRLIELRDNLKTKGTSEGSFIQKAINEVLPEKSSISVKPMERVVDARPTKAASDINAHLVEKGFEALPFEEQSKIPVGSYKEETQRIASMMDTSIEKVKDMATGKTEMAPDIKYPQLVFNAIEAHALEVGDHELLRDLAKSPLGTKLSEAGGTLGSHGFNDNPHSPIRIMREIRQVREQVSTKKGISIKSEVGKIKASIRKTHTKETWGEFVNSITC